MSTYDDVHAEAVHDYLDNEPEPDVPTVAELAERETTAHDMAMAHRCPHCGWRLMPGHVNEIQHKIKYHRDLMPDRAVLPDDLPF